MTKQVPKQYRTGMFLYYRNETYQIKAIKEHGLVFEVTNMASNSSSELSRLDLAAPNQPHPPLTASTLEQLQNLIKNLNIPQTAPPSVDIDPPKLALAREFLETVKLVDEKLDSARVLALVEQRKFSQTAELKTITKTLGMSVATYYNRRNRITQFNQSLTAIAASFTHERQSGISRPLEHFLVVLITSYSTEVPAQLFEIFRSTWQHTGGIWVDPGQIEGKVPDKLVAELLNPKISISDIQTNPDNLGILVPVNLISRSKFYEFYRAFIATPETGKAVVDAASGEGAWDRMFRVFDTFLHLASFPLQYVFADHYCLDVFSIDKKGRQKVRRLWLTVLIDAYSRCIIGFALLYEHPSIESILQALANSIWSKTNMAEFGIQGVWLCHGIPLQLFLDNAWAHHSYSLEDTARQISSNGQYNSIDLVFRPPYMGRLGALVERFFGTLSLRIRRRLKDKGAIQSSHPRDVRNAVQTACLIYEDIYKFIFDEIVNYQNTPHDGLNKMTPNAKWEGAMEFTPPIVPPQTLEFQRLFWREHNEKLKRTSKGLSFMGMKYNSAQLQAYPKYDKTGNENIFTVRYDPLDISTVAVYCNGKPINPKDPDVHPSALRLPDGSYYKVSVAEREIAKDYARAAGRQMPSRDWVDYLHELRGTVTDRTEEMRATRNPKPAKNGRSAKPASERSASSPIVPNINPDSSSGSGFEIIGGSNSDIHLTGWVHIGSDN